jgi:uncharacterized membrane protein YgdD (TMEM256/DUF423 family)
MPAPRTNRRPLRLLILSGAGMFCFVISMFVYLLVDRKETGFADPIAGFLLIVGIIAFVVCLLCIKLLVQMRRRGELDHKGS